MKKNELHVLRNLTDEEIKNHQSISKQIKTYVKLETFQMNFDIDVYRLRKLQKEHPEYLVWDCFDIKQTLGDLILWDRLEKGRTYLLKLAPCGHAEACN